MAASQWRGSRRTGKERGEKEEEGHTVKERHANKFRTPYIARSCVPISAESTQARSDQATKLDIV